MNKDGEFLRDLARCYVETCASFRFLLLDFFDEKEYILKITQGLTRG